MRYLYLIALSLNNNANNFHSHYFIFLEEFSIPITHTTLIAFHSAVL